MTADRVTKLTIRGMRCIEELTFDIGGFLVLAGENGVGKSTILEAFEILRLAATERPFIGKLYERHGGTRLFRDKSDLELEVTINGLAYRLVVHREEAYLSVVQEMLTNVDRVIMLRNLGVVSVISSDGNTVEREGHPSPDDTVISQAKFLNVPELDRVASALASIEVHRPLDLRASWLAVQGIPSARGSNVVRPAERLELGGYNLVNVFAAMKNQRNWDEIFGSVRLGLGDVESVLIRAEPSGGTHALWIRWENGLEVPLHGLSDGQVSYLGLIAIRKMERRMPPSLIAIDEPETHLHPGLAKRAAIGFEELSAEIATIVSTQSDAVLDAISDPVKSLLLCRLDRNRRTHAIKPSAEELKDWLPDFRGVGDLRREGFENMVFPRVS